MKEALKYDNYKKEMIDGKIYFMAPAPPQHSFIISKLHLKFGNYLEEKNKKCKAITEGLAVYLDDEGSYVQPDLSILCEENKFTKRGYEGAPELVVEVLSKSTMEYDRTDKLKKYEKSGVKEYWIVDLNNKSIEQLILIDEKYNLKRLAVLMDEWEIENLTKEKREQYSTIIKPEIFNDLEIDLKYVFDVF